MIRSLGATLAAAALLAVAGVRAESVDLLFHSPLLGAELVQSESHLHLTHTIVDDEGWAALTTENFTQFKAIVIGNPQCRDASALDFWKASASKWLPAITGNIVVFSTARVLTQQDVWTSLIDQAITFAASGQGTGLYFTTSCLPEGEHAIDALAPFGEFAASDNLPVGGKATSHQTSVFPNVPAFSDNDLGDFDLNLAGLFTKFPSSGPKAFDPVVVWHKPDLPGQLSFPGGVSGLPFIIARGASPLTCGDGRFDPEFEECDPSAAAAVLRFARRDGVDASKCTSTCHCVEGVVCAKGKPPGSSSSVSSSSTTSTAGSESTSGATTTRDPAGGKGKGKGTATSTGPGGVSGTGRPGGGSGSGDRGDGGKNDGNNGGNDEDGDNGEDNGSGKGQNDGGDGTSGPGKNGGKGKGDGGKNGGKGKGDSDHPSGDHVPDGDDDHPGDHHDGDHGHYDDDDDNGGYGHGVFIHHPDPSDHGDRELHHRPQGPNVVGIEIILIVDYVYVCPPGSVITTTHTKYLSTLTRPVYHTPVPDYPCYTDVFGRFDPNVYTTIVWESCPAKPAPLPVYTVRNCHSCDFATYTTAYPQYTPGLPCYSCVGADEPIEIPVVAAAAVEPTYAANTYAYVAPQATQTASPRVQVAGAESKHQPVGLAVGVLGGIAAAMAAL